MTSAKSCPSSLLENVEELLKLQGVESQRVEFKKAWHNLKGTPRSIYWQIIHTITAFANDLYNVNGGYIIIGVEEKEDCESPDSLQVILPPLGVTGNLWKYRRRYLELVERTSNLKLIPYCNLWSSMEKKFSLSGSDLRIIGHIRAEKVTSQTNGTIT